MATDRSQHGLQVNNTMLGIADAPPKKEEAT